MYLGSTTGLSTTFVWSGEGNQVLAAFGYSVASAGDVNSDGYSDIIVGVPWWNSGPDPEDEDVGRALLYLGSASGPAGTASWTLEGGQAGADLGLSVASAGDVNGDGFSDVIIGQPFYLNGIGAGRVLVFHGSASGLPVTPQWIVESMGGGEELGYSVASAGDVNGDGYDDVIVGGPATGTGAGTAYVFHGSASGLSSTADLVIPGGQSGSQFGWSVASAGDVNADGFDDVIVGAPNYDNGENNEGQAFLYRGSSSGLESTASWTTESNVADGLLGTSVASTRNVNGDCGDDIIIGTPRQLGFFGIVGRALVYEGLPIDTDSDWLCDSWELNGIDVNNDSIIDLTLPGANHEHKDLFVEIDAMVDRVPTTAAMDAVVTAFANAPIGNPDGMNGITLHYDIDDTNVPPASWAANPWPQFHAVKDIFFGTDSERNHPNRDAILRAKLKAYRYCVFADTWGTQNSSGRAEGPVGNDFMVTLGGFPTAGGTDEQKSAAFMHELGHNLGLGHDGPPAQPPLFIEQHHKPNYHSVMNYTWTFRAPSYRLSWQLDYSDTAFPTLNENLLDEPAGIGGHVGHDVPVGPRSAGVIPVVENGAVDWNRMNGPVDTGVSADANWINPRFGPSPGQTLEGHDDWSNLQYELVGHVNFTGGTTQPTTADEITAADLEMLIDEVDTDCNSNGILDHSDIASCTSEDCQGNGVPDDCEIATGTSQDSNSNGIPDECECATLPPTEIPLLSVHRGYQSWTQPMTSTFYDVVQGDLDQLRSTGGDFTASLLGCVANDHELPSVVFDDNPPANQAWFFLVRGANCGGNGTLDSGGTSQSGSRDAEVDASPVTCPAFECGNRIMEPGEVCDKWDLGCETCQSQGFSSGTLACADTCDAYDTSACNP